MLTMSSKGYRRRILGIIGGRVLGLGMYKAVWGMYEEPWPEGLELLMVTDVNRDNEQDRDKSGVSLRHIVMKKLWVLGRGLAKGVWGRGLLRAHRATRLHLHCYKRLQLHMHLSQSLSVPSSPPTIALLVFSHDPSSSTSSLPSSSTISLLFLFILPPPSSVFLSLFLSPPTLSLSFLLSFLPSSLLPTLFLSICPSLCVIIQLTFF